MEAGDLHLPAFLHWCSSSLSSVNEAAGINATTLGEGQRDASKAAQRLQFMSSPVFGGELDA